MLANLGDAAYNNRFWRAVLPDRTVDYTLTSPSPWTVQDNYHGVSGPGATQSMQPAAMAFGPRERVIYCGVDEQTEWWNFMELPLDGATPDQARFYHLYGFSTGFGNGVPNPFVGSSRTHFFPLIQTVNQPRSELNGPMATVLFDRADSGMLGVANRVLYAANATTARDDWVQAASIRATSSLTTAIYGGRIYLSGFGYGLKSVPVPQVKSLRPILAAPGGKNLVRVACARELITATATEFEALSPVPPPGESWVDSMDDRVLPLAPSLGDRLFRIRTKLVYPDPQPPTPGRAGLIRVSSDDTTNWNEVSPFWQTQPSTVSRVRRFRGWALDGTRGRFTPNKTTMLSAAFNDSTPGSAGVFGAPLSYSCDDRWSPYTQIGVQALGDGFGLGILIRATDISSDTAKEENLEYFLVGEALDGNGSLPYPLAPEADGQDERLTISGLGLPAGGPWSFRVAGMVPVGNWDHYAQRETFTGSGVIQNRWPLFTLWGDPDHYIEFVADCDAMGFRVRIKNGSGSPQEHTFGSGDNVWLPGSPLLVGIGYAPPVSEPGTGTLFVGASLGGLQVAVVSGGIGVTLVNALTELRFRGATGGYGTGAAGEVCEFRWFGGEIDAQNPPQTILNNSTLPTAFSTLSFLDGP